MKNLSFSKDLLRELVVKTQEINSSERTVLDSFLYNCRIRAINDDANSHSYAMEFPCKLNPSKCRRDVRKGAKRLEEAYAWGIKEYTSESFSQEYIQGLAGKVDPILHQGRAAAYRRNEARIQGFGYMPESPDKLDREMQKIVDETKRLVSSGKISDVLSAAVYSHLHLVRIHPFEDTNGRTARTLQNVILNSRGIPIPVIRSGEKRDYHSHLERAKNSWRDRINSSDGNNGELSAGELDFNDFIGGKVLVSLDTVLRNTH